MRWTTSSNATPQSSAMRPTGTSRSSEGSIGLDRRWFARTHGACGGEATLEVGDDIAHVLDAHGQPNHVFGDACFDLLDWRELLMRRGCRVDHQGLRIAHVGQK